MPSKGKIMSDTDGYNGWTNRATRAVALHVNNDQGWQEQVGDLVRERISQSMEENDDGVFVQTDSDEDIRYDVADAVKDSVTAIVDPLAYIEEFGDVSLSAWVNGPGMAARDIGDLGEVNWHELAEWFIRDVRED